MYTTLSYHLDAYRMSNPLNSSRILSPDIYERHAVCQEPTVKEEIRCHSSQYSARLSAHQEDFVVNLMEQPKSNRRLRKHHPNDLPATFLVHLPNV
jgi:hypothetical protein